MNRLASPVGPGPRKSRLLLLFLWAGSIALLTYSYLNWRQFLEFDWRPLLPAAASPVAPPKATKVSATAIASHNPLPPVPAGSSSTDHSEMVRLRSMTAAIDASLDYVYGDLFRQLALAPATLSALRTLIINKQLAIDSRFAELRREDAGNDDPSHWPSILAAIEAEFRPAFVDLIGESGYRVADDYFASLWLRTSMRRLGELLYADGITLSSEKAERLLTILTEANPQRGVYAVVPPSSLEAARAVMTAEEFAAFSSLAVEMNGSAKAFEDAKALVREQRARGSTGN